MSPAVGLAGFCAIMTAAAVGKLLAADERDLVDVGTVLIVGGITLLASIWAGLETGWLSSMGLIAGTAVGSALLAVGGTAVARHW